MRKKYEGIVITTHRVKVCMLCNRVTHKIINEQSMLSSLNHTCISSSNQCQHLLLSSCMTSSERNLLHQR